ncbi:MAG TPA: nucleotidyl transferase AbiEii/AbiGii toxin family protein, partial [Bryobacteraceae bacterium]|nr:nucleotidyl transferase AbiEii/AbiGii toxin family protein [Bryobacteraceae bacterium]
MDFAEIRRVTITALFSDDVLYERLVLKGGNALSLVYGITQRTSLDLDFSMAGDFDDIEDARRRIFSALRDRFATKGYIVFDEGLEPKPRLDGEDIKPWWGGYELRFKLMEGARHKALHARPDRLRIEALPT